MAAKSNNEESGANILPIPPALEFPFPHKGNERPSAYSTCSNTDAGSSGGPITSVTEGASSEPSPAIAANLRTTATTTTPNPRPSLPKGKFLTERPVLAQRGTRLGLGRRQTTTGRTALTDAAWRSDSVSDFSSSSEDENAQGLKKTRSTVSGQARKEKGSHVMKTDKDGRRGRSIGAQFSQFSVGNDDFKTKGKVSKTSGRLDISVNETSNRGYLAKALGTSLQHHLNLKHHREDAGHPSTSPSPLHEEDSTARPSLGARLSTLGVAKRVDEKSIPKLNLVIMVIGSRGDIQPFLKLGKILKEQHGHRVRIATHPAFRDFVEKDIGLEFFSVGGDPAELMAFMVKNPGLMPSAATIRAGEIGKKRESMFEMFQGFWRACINATDDESDLSNLKMMGDKHPFVADAIIANPPSFAHIHCAERLGIPLHLMFTFPYSPTQQFPHPLANIKQSNVDTNYANFISYPLVEMMTWQGLGDLVNRFRVKTLGLEPVSTLWAPGQLFRLKVPYTYLWSPGLIPKPVDWGPEIDIAGFVFLDLASSFKPPETLDEFLKAGEPPVYIGFGSIVVDDPDKFTKLIFEAVSKAGVRALVSKGWGGLGDEGNTPDNIYMLENTPHDWLFPRVSAVVHHGGAGTTAIGLKCGKPTMIVPFFGDQPFWGSMVAKAGAGAREPIPYKKLSADALAEGIRQCLLPESRAAAEKLAHDIDIEGDGASNAVDSFHNHLQMRGEHSMRCSILQDRVAVWELKKKSALRLSALAAEILVVRKKIRWHELRLLRHRDWNDFEGPGEPFTGGGAALLGSAGSIAMGIGGVPIRWAKSLKKRRMGTQRKEHRKRSQAKTTSSESKKASSTKQNNKPVENGGELSHGGQHGIEKHLPEAQPPGNAVSFENYQNPANGGAVGPIPGHVTDRDEDETMYSDATEDSQDNIAQDIAQGTRTGLVKSGEALAKAPMDLALALAQGFHNAPRLYGDSTVRTPIRISGIQSGLRAAGEEFTFGIYDGVTGLVLQPYHGGQERGALGFVLGIGKGFGGFILKDLAAIIGPIGYTLKGIHKEMVKTHQPTAFIRNARIIQGEKDMRALSPDALSAIEAKLDAAWALVIEIWNEVDRTKAEGLRSRLAIARERKRLERAGAFENIETTTRAFRAWQQEKEEADRAARKGKLQKKNSRAKARGVVVGQPAVIENV